MRTFGVDVAHEGGDKSVCVIREDNRVLLIDVWAKADIPHSAERVERLWRRYGADEIIIDCDGLGVGVRDILRQRGLPTVAFHGQAKTARKDETGELGFANMRSLAWYNLRQLLDPHQGHLLILPKHDGLLGDLVCPRWDVINQRITVEPKDQIKRRLGRSPDIGDALAYAFCPNEPSLFEDAYRVMTDEDVTALAYQRQPKAVRPEAEQVDELMWRGAHSNFDIFGDY